MNREVVLRRSAVSRYRALLLLVLALAIGACLVAGCGPNNSGNTPQPSQSSSQDGY